MKKRAPEPAPQARPAAAGRWLVKQEPDSYAWADFAREGRASWEGVRNYQARNNLGLMRPGDQVLFYASGDLRSVVGVAAVSKAAYPDPTAEEPGWVAVELRPVRALLRPVALARIKADPALASILLVRNSRLSVMPIPRDAFERIVAMGA
jgi:predicted RNA-binding protein with PUA-like domain